MSVRTETAYANDFAFIVNMICHRMVEELPPGVPFIFQGNYRTYLG